MQSDLFNHAVCEISREYAALGHELGWRFLCVSAKNLRPSTAIALITANPGGDSIPEHHPSASCEEGPAYLIEQWGTSAIGRHKLQRQVQELFNTISAECGLVNDAGPDLLTQSLAAYFIPFRSPRLSQLHRRHESRVFANRLWTHLFRELAPQLIITIDRGTHEEMRSILEKAKGASLVSAMELPTGWGQYRASVDEYRNGSYETVLVRLPHLSTFQLFTSARCHGHVQSIIRHACTHLRPEALMGQSKHG